MVWHGSNLIKFLVDYFWILKKLCKNESSLLMKNSKHKWTSLASTNNFFNFSSIRKFTLWTLLIIIFCLVPRDINERGRDLEQVLNQYMNFVKPAFEEFCLPVINKYFLIDYYFKMFLCYLLYFKYYRLKNLLILSYQEEQKILVTYLFFNHTVILPTMKEQNSVVIDKYIEELYLPRIISSLRSLMAQCILTLRFWA